MVLRLMCTSSIGGLLHAVAERQRASPCHLTAYALVYSSSFVPVSSQTCIPVGPSTHVQEQWYSRVCFKPCFPSQEVLPVYTGICTGHRLYRQHLHGLWVH